MAKVSKETRIKRKKSELLEIFSTLDGNKLKTAMTLIERAAFMTVSLEDLEEALRTDGWVEDYQNGQNQFGRKKSANADVYLSMTKNLTAIVKQLLDIVPAEKQKSKLEELLR